MSRRSPRCAPWWKGWRRIGPCGRPLSRSTSIPSDAPRLVAMSDASDAATIHEPEQVSPEGPPDDRLPELDAQARERRTAALAQIRTFGDPVLKSRASEITSFGPELEREAERMIAIMRDAIGVGLAATQLGVMHRLLVFQAGLDATPTAIANPELEWMSDEVATAEEGCLSLPRVAVDVERPLYARVRGRGHPRGAAPRRGLRPRGAGSPARARPPRRRAHARPHDEGATQGGARRAPRRHGLLSERPRRRSLKTVYMGTSEFAAKVLGRLADSPHRPALVVAPPDRPRGRGRRTASPPVADESAELGLDLIQTESVNSDDALERIRAADAELGVVCAFGQLIREPLLAELSMLNVHPSLLPRWRGAAPIERAIIAGDRLTG